MTLTLASSPFDRTNVVGDTMVVIIMLMAPPVSKLCSLGMLGKRRCMIILWTTMGFWTAPLWWEGADAMATEWSIYLTTRLGVGSGVEKKKQHENENKLWWLYRLPNLLVFSDVSENMSLKAIKMLRRNMIVCIFKNKTRILKFFSNQKLGLTLKRNQNNRLQQITRHGEVPCASIVSWLMMSVGSAE